MQRLSFSLAAKKKRVVLAVNFVLVVPGPTVPSLQRDTLPLSLVVEGASELTVVCGSNCRRLGSRFETERHFSLSTWNKVVSVLPELTTTVRVSSPNNDEQQHHTREKNPDRSDGGKE